MRQLDIHVEITMNWKSGRIDITILYETTYKILFYGQCIMYLGIFYIWRTSKYPINRIIIGLLKDFKVYIAYKNK